MTTKSKTSYSNLTIQRGRILPSQNLSSEARHNCLALYPILDRGDHGLGQA
uniref:Uncharacterized protein n=1 Tax=Nelumbo nucifera TaxID=4432 RepID=A0A822ZWZ1_NELNU|nr:TPA_asm: hypothetical protein HUJ06_017323 [Nelumbo nucifera]